MFLGLAKLIVDRQQILASDIVAKRSQSQGHSTGLIPGSRYKIASTISRITFTSKSGRANPDSDRLTPGASAGVRLTRIFAQRTLLVKPGQNSSVRRWFFSLGKLYVILCLES